MGAAAGGLVVQDVGQEGNQAELLGRHIGVAQTVDLEGVLVNQLLSLAPRSYIMVFPYVLHLSCRMALTYI